MDHIESRKVYPCFTETHANTIHLNSGEWYWTFSTVISSVFRMNVTVHCGTRRYNSRLPYLLYQVVQQIRGGEPCKVTVKQKIQNSQKQSPFRKWILNRNMPDSLICKDSFASPQINIGKQQFKLQQLTTCFSAQYRSQLQQIISLPNTESAPATYANKPFANYINLLKTKRRPLYLNTQSVPRCKHFSSRL